MAIKIDHKIKVSYTLGGYMGKDYYKDKLTEVQFNELDDSIVRECIVPKAYCKVNTYSGDKDKISINLVIYKDENKGIVIDTKSYVFTPSVEDNAENFIRQGYEYLKTLPEYADAIDC